MSMMLDEQTAGTSQPEKLPKTEEVDHNCPSCAEDVVDDGVQCQWCAHSKKLIHFLIQER